MKKDAIVFFDIDYTLFDTARFREKLFRSVADVLLIDASKVVEFHEMIMQDIEINKVFFDPKTYSQLFAGRINDEKKAALIFDAVHQEQIFIDNYYEETKEVLRLLSKHVAIGIFSKGETVFQKKKLKDIEHFFSANHVYITADKHKTLPGLLDIYKEQMLYFVDDALDVLHKAKMLRSDVLVIWVKRGKYAKKQRPIEGFTPDAIIENLRELLPIILN